MPKKVQSPVPARGARPGYNPGEDQAGAHRPDDGQGSQEMEGFAMPEMGGRHRGCDASRSGPDRGKSCRAGSIGRDRELYI